MKKGGVELNDSRLIKKIQRTGDRDAADQLVRHYYDDIHNYIRRQISDENQAIELTQETFISMLKTIQYYDKKKGASFRTWLYRIATNKLTDWFRSSAYSQMRGTIQLEDIEPVDHLDLELQYENKERLEKIGQFVTDFPADTQNIFRLHIFGSYTFDEIAKMTDQAEGTIKSKYYRFIRLVRKEFYDEN